MANDVTVTQAGVEALRAGTPAVAVTQAGVEALRAGTPAVAVTLLGVEVLRDFLGSSSAPPSTEPPSGLGHLEIWTALECEGGSPLATLTEVLSAVKTESLTGEESLAVTVGVESPAIDEIQGGRVVRVVYLNDVIEEWSITSVGSRHASNRATTLVTCDNPLVALGQQSLAVGRTEADGFTHYDFTITGLSPTDHLEQVVLPALQAQGITWVAVGTVESTAPLDVSYAWSSPLEVLRALAELTGLELRFRRFGTSQYLIDLLEQVGADAERLEVVLAKNLTAVERDRSVVGQATVVLPRGPVVDGASATMARAIWRVAARTGNDLTLEDPAGGAGPVGVDGQLEGMGLYLRRPSGLLTAVIASDADTQVVTVADATGVAVGDLVEFRLNASGTDLTYLSRPLDVATYGTLVRVAPREDASGTVNLLRNPAMRQWSGAASSPPNSWAVIGAATVSQSTDPTRWRHGGRSARVLTTADGQGLETAYAAVRPTGTVRFVSGFVAFQLVSGEIRVELVATDGITTWVFPEIDQAAVSNQVGSWIELAVAGIDVSQLGVTQAKLRLVQHGAGTADVYVDAAQLTQTGAAVPFEEGAGPTKLWQEANRVLAESALPRVRYAVSILDLHALHPELWPDQPVVLGGAVVVEDAELGIEVVTRILEVQRELVGTRLADLRVVLSSRPGEFTENAIRRRVNARYVPASSPGQTTDPSAALALVDAEFDPVDGAPDSVRVTLYARPEGASAKYVVLPAGTAIPPIGDAAWLTYAAPFVQARDAATTLELHAYAVYFGSPSLIRTWRIARSGAVVCPDVSFTTGFAAEANANVGYIRASFAVPADARFKTMKYRHRSRKVGTGDDAWGGEATVQGTRTGPDSLPAGFNLEYEITPIAVSIYEIEQEGTTQTVIMPANPAAELLDALGVGPMTTADILREPTRVLYRFTPDADCVWIEVFSVEFTTDPGSVAGLNDGRTPTRAFDALVGQVMSLALPLSGAAHYRVTTFVPYDALGRAGVVLTFTTQGNGTATVPDALTAANVSVPLAMAMIGAVVTNTVTPASGTQKIRCYRNGQQFGADLGPFTVAVPQNVTHYAWSQQTDTWEYCHVDGAGLEGPKTAAFTTVTPLLQLQTPELVDVFREPDPDGQPGKYVTVRWLIPAIHVAVFSSGAGPVFKGPFTEVQRKTASDWGDRADAKLATSYSEPNSYLGTSSYRVYAYFTGWADSAMSDAGSVGV